MNFAQMSDEEVVCLAQKGNEEAVEYILEKYKALIKARVRAYFLVGADKEDLLQEGMIGLFKAIRDFAAEKQANSHRLQSFAQQGRLLLQLKPQRGRSICLLTTIFR